MYYQKLFGTVIRCSDRHYVWILLTAGIQKVCWCNLRVMQGLARTQNIKEHELCRCCMVRVMQKALCLLKQNCKVIITVFWHFLSHFIYTFWTPSDLGYFAVLLMYMTLYSDMHHRSYHLQIYLHQLYSQVAWSLSTNLMLDQIVPHSMSLFSLLLVWQAFQLPPRKQCSLTAETAL